MQEQEPAGICDEMWTRKPFGISILVVMPRRGILLQSLFVSTKKNKQDFHKQMTNACMGDDDRVASVLQCSCRGMLQPAS
eukprot:g48175.t1